MKVAILSFTSKTIIFFIIFFVSSHIKLFAQEEGFCAICSRDAWAGDSAALNKFIAGCGVIDTIGYDSLNKPAKTNQAYQAITMKLNSGKVMFTDKIYFITDQMPEFKGGMEALLEYLTKNIHYPQTGKKISGTVYVKFIVEKDGSVKRADIVRGVGEEYDKEALRVIKEMPPWQPGTKKGNPVRVQFNLPVKFSLN
ncbi:MAG TPA: energy transducer TonB [Bacteroidia bacterium]|nr:energy transducer TonB [Bacteroidia bacterium]